MKEGKQSGDPAEAQQKQSPVIQFLTTDSEYLGRDTAVSSAEKSIRFGFSTIVSDARFLKKRRRKNLHIYVYRSYIQSWFYMPRV